MSGSRSTAASAWASAGGGAQPPQTRIAVGVGGDDQGAAGAIHLSLTGVRVAAQPLVGQPPLLLGRHPGQFQHVAVQLQLDGALRRAGQPGAHRRHHRAEQLRLGGGDDQRAQRRQLHPPGTRRGLASAGQLDRLHLEVQQLTAKLQGGLGDLLGVVVGPGADLDAERRRSLFHARPLGRPAHT